ncbi:envelope stress sensor histidine kinase CpxA [Vibrio sp. MA40-2]|uniref:envelope stress sensor histidine kinase CpxA n=1 Tax=Vibrio sp. MA40-2 TaxID=3391828 RepID=UPI0039A47830
MRLPKFSNLYGRIFSIFWFTMLLVLIAVLIVQDSDPRQTHTIQKTNTERLISYAEYLQHKYQHAQSIDEILKTYDKKRKEDKSGRKPAIFFSDLSGNLIDQKNRRQRRTIQNFITSLESLEQPQQRLYGRLMVVGPIPVTVANQQALLFIAGEWGGTPPFLLQLFEQPIKLLLVIMAVSTPLLLWLAYALSKPARRLENAARRVANGEFIEDPDLETGSSEFRQAGAAFNQMVLAINQMISGNQRLLSDISHELRSPLTRLRMANALATRKQGESSELTRIDTEAERLEKMISELLTLSRMQNNSHQVRETHSASVLWQDIIADAQFEAEQHKKSLTYTKAPDCLISGNPSLLMSAVENIIRNAIHYGNTTITVHFQQTNKALKIGVEDDGEGVPENELKDIFRPFYRVSTARDRNSGGTGLGLAITESAVRQHNGTILAEKSTLGGLKVTITLPIEK